MKDVMVIANPVSAGGRTGRGWPAVAARLRDAGLRFDVAMTESRGDAILFARDAVKEGRPLVVAAGGDGTVNEVANGFFEHGERLPTDSRLGVLPMGTGGDFRRTFEIPVEVAAAAAVLREGRTRRIDAGRVTFTTQGGRRLVRHFVNIADAGLGGEVVHRVNSGRRLLSGEFTFLAASVAALVRWRNLPMRALVDGEAWEGVAQQVVVANCQYYGGGMRVAPWALPDDGLLDVLIVDDLGLWENARGLRKIRAGTHLDTAGPKLHHLRARRVEVSSPARVRLDVDGEQPGVLPCLFEVMPGAIDLVCP